MEFVADLTGGFGLNPKGIIPTEESKFEGNIMNAILKPTASLVRAGYGFGQAMMGIGDIIEPGV